MIYIGSAHCVIATTTRYYIIKNYLKALLLHDQKITYYFYTIDLFSPQKNIARATHSKSKYLKQNLKKIFFIVQRVFVIAS